MNYTGPFRRQYIVCHCGALKEPFRMWCPECHERAKAELVVAPVEISPEEQIRVERNLGPACGSLPIDQMIKLNRTARNGRVLRNNKSIQ